MREIHYFYEPSLSGRANALFRCLDIKTEEQARRELPSKLKGFKQYNLGKKTIAEVKAWLIAGTSYTLTLTGSQLEKLQEVLWQTYDEGPVNEGWASDELQELRNLVDSVAGSRVGVELR